MKQKQHNGEIVVYQPDEITRLEVMVENETVWLTQAHLAQLFGVNQPAISKHIRNIYSSGELSPEDTYSILEYMGNDGKQKYSLKYYNLDMILSVGFYDGQIFDAYVFVSGLIKSARNRIVLIDNYIDESVLLMLSKRATKVTAEIRTGRLPQTLLLDLQKHNSQYATITLSQIHNIHDRFLIIDDDVYHIGASLKDLGKKLFAFSKMMVETDKLL